MVLIHLFPIHIQRTFGTQLMQVPLNVMHLVHMYMYGGGAGVMYQKVCPIMSNSYRLLWLPTGIPKTAKNQASWLETMLWF